MKSREILYDTDECIVEKAESAIGVATYHNTGLVYSSRLKIVPVKHYYNEEKTYIKYGCPVCEAFGLRHSMQEGTESCTTCGVHFEWEEIDSEQ